MRNILSLCSTTLPHFRVVTRYVGSGIKGVGSGIRRVGSRITALGSGITDHGVGIISCFYRDPRDQGLGCGTTVGLETKIDQAFGIKEQKFANKNGISDEKKNTSLPPRLPFESHVL